MHNPVRYDEWLLLEPVLRNVGLLPRQVNAVHMLELGNKVNTKAGPSEGERITYKAFFTALGVRHVSVDINGQDGALPIDLRGNLRFALGIYKQHTQYDVVTNIGTTEHVVDQQRAVWQNIYDALRPGGWLLSITPLPGDWRWHGMWYPTVEFYAELIARNDMREGSLGGYGQAPRRNLYAVARKRVDAGAFVWPGDELLYDNRRAYADAQARGGR